jgi:hypothetical protein
MRVMARVSIPVQEGNRAVSDGSLPSLIQRTAERWHPEAMYFTTFDGRRTAYLVFDMPSAPDIPTFAEPFFTQLNAEVELAPVMDSADLQKGIAQLG